MAHHLPIEDVYITPQQEFTLGFISNMSSNLSTPVCNYTTSVGSSTTENCSFK